MKLSPNIFRRMLWLIWHHGYVFFQTIRYLPIILIWAIGFFLCFDIKYPPEFAAHGYISSATWLFFSAAWFGYVFLSGLDRTAEYILIMQINSRNLYAVSKVVFLLAVCAAFSLVCCLYPVIINTIYQFRGVTVFPGLSLSVFSGALLLHFIIGALGISTALLFQPNPMKREDSFSICFTIIFALFSIVKGQIIDQQNPLYFLFYVFPPLLDIINIFYNKNMFTVLDIAHAAAFGLVYSAVAVAAGQWLYNKRIYGPRMVITQH